MPVTTRSQTKAKRAAAEHGQVAKRQKVVRLTTKKDDDCSTEQHHNETSRCQGRLTFADLPVEVVQEVLDFLVPSPHLASRWTWLVRMRNVCNNTIWNAAQNYIPTVLCLESLFSSLSLEDYADEGFDELDRDGLENPVRFLRLVASRPCFREKIRLITNIGTLRQDTIPSPETKDALQDLFINPNYAFPKLFGIQLDFEVDFNLFDSSHFLNEFARMQGGTYNIIDRKNGPRTDPASCSGKQPLEFLVLDGCFDRNKEDSQVLDWRSACRYLQGLKTFILAGEYRFGDQGLIAIGKYLKDIHFLSLACCGEGEWPSDEGLVTFAGHCTTLEKLSFKVQQRFTYRGVSAVLASNPKLNFLDLETTCGMTRGESASSLTNVIRSRGKNIQSLHLHNNDWFDDDGLVDLAASSFQLINIESTQVTPQGLRRALQKNSNFVRTIDVGFNLVDLTNDKIFRSGMTYSRILEAGLLPEQYLDDLRESNEEEKFEWLSISRQYGINFKTRSNQCRRQ